MTIRVFVADDHAIVRDGLRSLLAAQPDIEVVGDASNGRDAVREVSKVAPDVVIMDIAMPVLNGIEAARQVHEELPETKIIFLSMHSTTEHIFRALQAGARGYLLKESAGVQVVDAVRSVYADRLYLSPSISEKVIEGYINHHETAEEKSPLDSLSPREREILQLVVEGKSSVEIAEILVLSPKTVETYRSRMMQKLGINDLPALVRFAIQHSLTPLE
ncbi:MAG: response regulator transcription factor [Chloroflexi bacterium]|jgi:DNA-binding NarL/FixJ family response regulator|nr:response regulator transcription factor [Chloroflexota bacterium]